MSDIARASLPVAIVLLILTTVAHGALLAPIDDARARLVARRYLEPLSTWCLVALGTHTLALIAAGSAGVFSLVVAVVLGVAAVLLRSVNETNEPAGDEPETFAPAPAAPVPTSTGTLWARERSSFHT
jgi:TctA family transporter